MPFKFGSKLPFVAALGLACLGAGSLAADTRPPAGQMCPEGAYVIGFDAGSNIVCSVVAGPLTATAPGAGNGVKSGGGDTCPAGCAEETRGATAAGNSEAAADLPAEKQTGDSDAGGPVIADIKPPWVVFGARETTIRIIGSGFTAGTTVKFQGAVYSTSVNAAGTELRVTIETSDLPMGRYAITVSNGDGVETTERRALEVF